MKSNLTSGFERLVMEHKSTIYAVCYMFVGTRADADDLFQEVLVKLWESYGKFRGDCTVRSWVYRKKRLRTLPLEISPEIIDGDSTGSRQSRLLHKRISGLEPVDRAIVLLWLENLAYDEIAAIVGVTPRAIGIRLVRIKEKLKSL